MRLIDADALLKKLNEEGIQYNADINYLITNAPTVDAVDAVQVVRCRDCKFQTVSFVDGSDYTCIRWHAKRAVMKDDFCSYGERKDDER